MTQLPRVVVLGGGVGGVTAAVNLSQPGWEQRFGSITLYQQGWRLGGKGASGRGAHERIEEHGLHIWFGFYENAFRMLRECHEELDALAKADPKTKGRWPLACDSMDASFSRCDEITLTDHDGCEWKPWVADFFDFDDDKPWAVPDPRVPGETPDDWSTVFYASRCLHLASDLASSLVHAGTATAQVAAQITDLDTRWETTWAGADTGTRDALRSAAHLLDAIVREGARHESLLLLADPVLRALDWGLDFLRGREDALVRADDSVRRAWYVVDILLAVVRGLIEDDIIATDDFSIIDDVEFQDWLRTHGASRESVDSALIRGVIYDLAFAYRGGDPRKPCAAAGTALRGLMRTFFTYRGSIMWKMNAGMGDVVFAPLYELLHKRGVDVRFFHRVEDVRAANGNVEEIEIDVQATVSPKMKAQNFLFDPSTGLLPSQARAVWPSKPTVALTSPMIESVETYESWLADPKISRVATTTLKRGALKDGFELVVFAMPPACIPRVAPDLMKQSPLWKNAAEKLETVPTQAMQLWLDRTADQLCDAKPGAVVGGYTEPYDTWADMEHLVPQEAVPGSKTIAYFCNVLADAPLPARGAAGATFLADQAALVRAHALRFLQRDIRFLWPLAADPLTGEFEWDMLVDPANRKGSSRLDAQYLRANVEPSERYVLSVPGSGMHRIPPGDTGFVNLYVAGDWTACGLDAGCVEAAAMSGLLAANAIHTDIGATAAVRPIIGYHHP